MEAATPHEVHRHTLHLGENVSVVHNDLSHLTLAGQGLTNESMKLKLRNQTRTPVTRMNATGTDGSRPTFHGKLDINLGPTDKPGLDPA